MAEVVSVLESSVDAFQVDDGDEFRRLRQHTNKETYVYGYTAPTDMAELVELSGIPALSSIQQLKFLDNIGEQKNVVLEAHVTIDACLGRDGLLLEDLDMFLQEAKSCRFVSLTSAYAHFANIEDTEDFSHAQKQIDYFESVKEVFRSHSYHDVEFHISATSGALRYEVTSRSHMAVRIGIGLYGIWPSEYLRAEVESKLELRPVMRWVTETAQIKQLPVGSSIGYGLTYITQKPMTVAVIPQGYSDGYDRRFSNNGNVLIHGTLCPILGRVMMNMFVVDVSHLDRPAQGEEVVLLGQQGDLKLSADTLAGRIDTINYELLARISPLISRKIV